MPAAYRTALSISVVTDVGSKRTNLLRYESVRPVVGARPMRHAGHTIFVSCDWLLDWHNPAVGSENASRPMKERGAPDSDSFAALLMTSRKAVFEEPFHASSSRQSYRLQITSRYIAKFLLSKFEVLLDREPHHSAINLVFSNGY
jgi:hypothetical protein